MFTGIIEEIGEVVRVVREGANLHLFVKCTFTKELKIDQSVAHNGVCLTVVAIDGDVYQVTALDGHIVQGHIDQTATCTAIKEEGGSKRFSFAYDPSTGNVVIEKGSVTVNGVSLTVVDATRDGFSVAVIPYTLAHTNLHRLAVGSVVNLEFDVIGKYVARLVQQR